MVTTLPSTALTGKTATMTGINVGEDDLTVYDEGTWTPVVKIDTTAITVAGSTTGQFTRIGNVVYFTCNLAFNRATNTGTLSVEGLPVASAGAALSAVSIRPNDKIDCDPPLSASVNGGETKIALYKSPTTTSENLGGMSDTQIPASTQVNMIITGFYFV